MTPHFLIVCTFLAVAYAYDAVQLVFGTSLSSNSIEIINGQPNVFIGRVYTGKLSAWTHWYMGGCRVESAYFIPTSELVFDMQSYLESGVTLDQLSLIVRDESLIIRVPVPAFSVQLNDYFKESAVRLSNFPGSSGEVVMGFEVQCLAGSKLYFDVSNVIHVVRNRPIDYSGPKILTTDVRTAEEVSRAECDNSQMLYCLRRTLFNAERVTRFESHVALLSEGVAELARINPVPRQHRRGWFNGVQFSLGNILRAGLGYSSAELGSPENPIFPGDIQLMSVQQFCHRRDQLRNRDIVECPICLEPLITPGEQQSDMQIAGTRCNHFFHAGCCVDFQSCPMCRAALQPRQSARDAQVRWQWLDDLVDGIFRSVVAPIIFLLILQYIISAISRVFRVRQQ